MFGKLGWMGVFSFAIAMGQSPGGQTGTPLAPASGAAKPLAFEVVSIRQNVSNVTAAQSFAATPDGFRMTGIPMMLPILTAFVPEAGGMFSPDRIQGMPDWVGHERYDLDARVGEQDRTDWQIPARQAVMLPAMMQAVLVDRCKLVAHRETKQNSVYFLVMGKTGPKFAETNPSDTPPTGVKLPGGALLVRSNNTLNLYGTSMGMFATMLTPMQGPGQPTIVDKTGLPGRYNIIVKSIISHAGEQNSGTEATDPEGSVFSAVEALGLKLVPGKSQVETLVIDHMERPSAN